MDRKDGLQHVAIARVVCRKRKKITYGQLDEEIQRRRLGHHVNVVVYGHPAGAIGDALLEVEQEIGVKIPPLNALVVNARSGIPGCGCDYYVGTYLGNDPNKKLSSEQLKAMAEETMKDVWEYKGWQELLKLWGLKPLEGNIPALQTINKIPIKSSPKGGWSDEPESEQHRLLKEWVAQNPHILKSRIPFHVGETEWLYASADRVDVMFQHDDGCIAVEIKSEISNDADIERGIYQCIKYQALLRAELKANNKIPNGYSVLVTSRKITPPLQQLAELLNVKVITVAPVKK
ncbi:MAG: hypothetical protein WAO71_06625 [Gallionella sp.]